MSAFVAMVEKASAHKMSASVCVDFVDVSTQWLRGI